MKRKVMVGMALAIALVMPLAGCASKGRISVAKMCAGAGGKYSAQTHSCDAPAQTGRKAADICQSHGGFYDPTTDTCEVGLD